MGFFSKPWAVFLSAILFRAGLLVYGLFQDAYSPLKYTDIDYYVFTDAARFTAQGRSPYTRDTYRYTPLLAWLLYPTTWSPLWFSFGKALFALSDVLAGWLIWSVLRSARSMDSERALKFASIWLLNPMVAQISTRGSSEGLLCAMVVALLWAVLEKRIKVAGVLLGLAVHFKIYPFIYAASVIWWLDETPSGRGQLAQTGNAGILSFVNKSRLTLAFYSLLTFMALNVSMYTIYGQPFLEHSFFYHLSRIDHRHNFSPYNILLYLNSSPSGNTTVRLESLAFLPQILFSTVFIPLALAKHDLPSTMLAQTFVFVTFNKVCTSQYFLWYLVFLPFYLPRSSLLERPSKGIAVLIAWILGQALWLQQGYQLEFLGNSVFVPGLFLSSIIFFFVNIGILGIIIEDIGRYEQSVGGMKSKTN